MKELTPEEHRVIREGGTEAPFSGKYVGHHEVGKYTCRACGAVLFDSSAKFDSGTGWPSFTNPAVAENIGTRHDDSNGMHHPKSTSKSLSRVAPNGFGARTEVFCKHCGSHLGHVFDDGPKEAGGKRYCINSVCLDFKKE